jgi:hypothetical protein
MRKSTVILLALIATACGRAEPTGFTLHKGKVERVNECHVLLDLAGGKDGRLVGLRYACGVPSSALTEVNWWGDQQQPLSFSMNLGDCLLLNSTFHCLEEVEHGKSATFKATYKQIRPGDVIQRIEEK